MAVLKIDVVVNDHGAEQKLRQIETATRGIDGATASASASIVKSSSATVSAFSSMSSAAMGFIKTTAAMFAGNLLFSVVNGIGNLGREAFRAAGTLTDLSARSGITISTLQRLSFVGMQAGVSMQAFADAGFMLGVRLNKGSDSVVAAVKQLGLNFAELRSMSPDQMMGAVLSALSKVGSEQERNRLGVELFGRSFKTISAAVTSDYDEMARAARTSGDAQIRALDAASDAWDRWVQNRKADATAALGTLVLVGQTAANLGIWDSVKGALAGAWQMARMDRGLLGAGNFSQMVVGGMGGILAKRPIDKSDVTLPNPNRKTAEDLEDEARELRRVTDERKRAAEEWQKFNDKISGREAIASAKTWLAHLRDVGGVTKLTKDATKDLVKVLDEAIAAYIRLGQRAPAAMLQTWAGLQTAQMVNPELTTSLSQSTLDDARKRAELKAMTERFMGFGVGPSLMLAGAPALVTSLSQETIDANLDSITRVINPWRDGFRALGQQLPDLIFNALRSGSIGGFITTVAGGLGQQFSQTFSKALAAAGGDMAKLGFGTKAMGMAGMGIGAGFQGFEIGGAVGSPGKGALAGAASGAMAGAGFGPIGMGVGAAIGAIGGWLGGRKAQKEARQQMEEQRAEWIKQFGGIQKLKELAAELNVNLGNAFSTKKPEEFRKSVELLNAAIERKNNLLAGVGLITEGTNARAANMGTQADANVVGAGALASFGLQVGTGTSAVQALANLSPSIEALRTSLAGGNVELGTATQRLLELAGIVEANRVPFQNLAADGQVLQGMMQGNIRDFDLFKAITTDIGVQLQGMIDKGVPTAQVFALAQPQLQAIWEAQQKWRFEVDGTTQALLDQAVQQGIVGENAKSVQQQMLDALVGMKDVLITIAQAMGALPNAAANAARGINDAFDSVRPPRFDPNQIEVESPELPEAHTGGLIGWRRLHGGGLASDEVPIIGQRGEFMISRRGVAAVGVGTLQRINRGESVGGGVTFAPGAIVINGDVDSEDRVTDLAIAIAEQIRLNKGGVFQRYQAALGNA
jgi:hypothetical protein